MDENEFKVYMETRLRNLKRKYSKLAQHPDLTDECEVVGKEIKSIEAEIKNLQ